MAQNRERTISCCILRIERVMDKIFHAENILLYEVFEKLYQTLH